MAIGEACRGFEAVFGGAAAAGVSDAALLDRFVTRGDEAAFTALVARHGPRVLGLCRDLLGDAHAAEDAYQATFLVLARRAGAIRERVSLGPWLHGVACRVSAGARADRARRRAVERRAGARPRPADDDPRDNGDARRAVHEEVGALPEKYRAPVVLCYFEGLTHDEAARRLGWPVGTVRGRLARARDRLRGRLARRGLAPAVAAALALDRPAVAAAVPPALDTLTIRAATRVAAGDSLVAATSAAALAEGVIRTMTLTKWTWAAAAVAAAGLVASGTGVLARSGQQGVGTTEEKPAVRQAASPDGAGKPTSGTVMPESERLRKIEDAVLSLQKQSEAMRKEMRSEIRQIAAETKQAAQAKPAAPTESIKPEEYAELIQAIQKMRGEGLAEITASLQQIRTRADTLRNELRQAERAIAALQAMQESLSRVSPAEESVLDVEPEARRLSRRGPAEGRRSSRRPTPVAPPQIEAVPEPVIPTADVPTPEVVEATPLRLPEAPVDLGELQRQIRQLQEENRRLRASRRGD